MKFITSILLTALLAFALGLQLPWFTIAVASCIVAFLIPQKTAKAFASGSLGIALLWLMLSVIHMLNGGKAIATQMAGILPLQQNVPLLITVTIVIGALVGGIGALTGSYARQLFSKKVS
jgi:succinate dehydrogenase hydrophobic anchor subunit